MLIKSRHVICDSADCFFMVLLLYRLLLCFYMRTLVYIIIVSYKIVVDKTVVHRGTTEFLGGSGEVLSYFFQSAIIRFLIDVIA